MIGTVGNLRGEDNSGAGIGLNTVDVEAYLQGHSYVLRDWGRRGGRVDVDTVGSPLIAIHITEGALTTYDGSEELVFSLRNCGGLQCYVCNSCRRPASGRQWAVMSRYDNTMYLADLRKNGNSSFIAYGRLEWSNSKEEAWAVLSGQARKEESSARARNLCLKRKGFVSSDSFEFSSYVNSERVRYLVSGDFSLVPESINFGALFNAYVEEYYAQCRNHLPAGAKEVRLSEETNNGVIEIVLVMDPRFTDAYEVFYSEYRKALLFSMLGSKKSRILSANSDMRRLLTNEGCGSKVVRQFQENLWLYVQGQPSMQDAAKCG
jgi:hypothetical protein